MIIRYWNENYRPSDIDILKYVAKKDRNHDFAHDPMVPASAVRSSYNRPEVAPSPNEGLPMQPMAQLGRRMTDMSGADVHGASRGFAFDEDPYPRRSTGSRPASLMEQKTRPRRNSIKIGPVKLPLPGVISPSRRLKKRPATASTVDERPELHMERPSTPLRQSQGPPQEPDSPTAGRVSSANSQPTSEGGGAPLMFPVSER